MTCTSCKTKLSQVMCACVSVVAIEAFAGETMAGGFAIREQSVSSQGASFAGSAAGGDLSSIFWNPAATGAKNGMNTESHNSLIIPRAEIDVNSATNVVPAIQAALNAADPSSGNIGQLALVGASYGNYQLSPDLWIGFGLNSGFGLSTKPDNVNYRGAQLGRSTKLFTLNANPTLAYKIAPGVLLGAGLQVQYADGSLKFATGVPQGLTTYFDGDDFAFGATAGILLQPSSGTSIGLGYRSRLSHTLDGNFTTNGTALNIAAEADVDLPDIVTLSIRQAIAPRTRLLGTVEWSNWSRFEDLTVVSKQNGATVLTGPVAAGGTVGTIPANWDDGWFFALGGEYDYSPTVTLRAGVAYEISPVDSPEKRIVTIPDADRVWLSGGATMRITNSMEVDFAYTHVFIEDGDFTRQTLTNPVLPASTITGTSDAAVDIVSVSLKSKW